MRRLLLLLILASPLQAQQEALNRVLNGTETLVQADSILAADSSVDGLATSGWLRLYRGDVRGAIERFKAAGPFAGERADATHRTVLLAMLQPIEADSVPELGRAFFAVARGDTVDALAAFERTAAQLPAGKGGAEVRLYAGHLAAAAGKSAEAERLLRSASGPEAPGTAPAAELALGELFLSQRRATEAVQVFEHLILTYPASALVPQARRKLDQVRGVVPRP